MTIFDSIRYSNIDIFDSTEMARLHPDIFDTWISNISSNVEFPESIQTPRCNADFGVISQNVICMVVNSHPFINRETQLFMVRFYKSKFTRALKDVIYNHNSDL